MIAAEELIPQVYESDKIFAQYVEIEKEFAAAPPYTTRAEELRKKLLDRMGDYLNVLQTEEETIGLQLQVASIAVKQDHLALAQEIIDNATARHAIARANFDALGEAMWKL
jgi:hypothetical protein